MSNLVVIPTYFSRIVSLISPVFINIHEYESKIICILGNTVKCYALALIKVQVCFYSALSSRDINIFVSTPLDFS